MKRTSKWAMTGFTLVLVYAFVFLVFWFLNFQKVVVSGVSLEKTLHTGQPLWACRAYWLVGPIDKGSIVVIREVEANDYIIKRVYRMGGETVDYAWIPRSYSITQGPYKVPKDQIYVMGDNRSESEDSRAFGPVPIDRVIGKVVFFTFWSFFAAVAPILLIVLGSFVCKPRPEGQVASGDASSAT